MHSNVLKSEVEENVLEIVERWRGREMPREQPSEGGQGADPSPKLQPEMKGSRVQSTSFPDD